MISLDRRGFDESITYQAYKPWNVYKCSSEDIYNIQQELITLLSSIENNK